MWSQKISSYSLVQFNSLLFVLAFNIGMFKYRLCVIIFRFKTEQRMSLHRKYDCCDKTIQNQN